MGTLLALVVIALALLGTPLFAVMGGSSELLWLLHDDSTKHFLRFVAPNVMDERFADSPILVTIPLFTLVGYTMAESKAPDRIVRASAAFFGWMPGGLAMVCIVASAFFTMVTGGSGVTIVAIGGLLYPALRKQGYPADYALGLVTTGGSLGLLLPSLPVLVYALVAGIDINAAFKAGLVPMLLISVLLGVHAAWIGVKYRVPRQPPSLAEMGAALWLLKWEIGVPVVLLGSLGSGLAGLDEAAALTAAYTLAVELFVHRDLTVKKDLLRVAKSSMALAGAIILILSMANALINFVVDQRVPGRMLELMLSIGLTQKWQFLLVLNIFLLLLGMLMEGFSAILVAVPLMLPFAAKFELHPFHLAVMFLLNLEIAYVAPPLGLNLFIASFRFDKPLASLYRVVLPFTAILAVGLGLVMYVPRIATVLVDGDIRAARAKAEARKETPRDAWLMECVQDDRSNPIPCTAEDRARFGADGTKNPWAEAAPKAAPEPAPDAGAGDSDDLLRQMLGGDAAAPKPAAGGDDDLLQQMLAAGSPDAGAGAADAGATKPAALSPDEALLQEMLK